jgi:acyl-CoA carboxylase subunit alpha
MTRFSRVLIANRAEVAARVIRTLDEMGIGSVAVFSDADAELPFVHDADMAVRLPGTTPAETYLSIDAIIAAAKTTGADAIHPGYGFLAENADFATRCTDAGITFIGPSPAAIAAMGSKVEAKKLVRDAGVPLLDDVDVSDPEAVPYPVLVKASAGGGGRGMRIVRSADELEAGMESARLEAANAFGDDTIFVERWLENVRHIEVQVIGDMHGNVAHLFERECSIQRRHQKVVEEAPSGAMTTEMRERLTNSAVAAAVAVDYVGVGTVEFLVAGDEFFFLEMNTRLQVEHPVTEMVTGIDLVREQVAVAMGEPLSSQVRNATVYGHAIEVRLYAEDPLAGWLPGTGPLHSFWFDDIVRVDAGYESGSVVGTDYDPMLAKVIAYADTRTETAGVLARAMRGAEIHGPRSNRDLLVGILENSDFLAGNTPTSFLEDHTLEALLAPDPSRIRDHVVAATLATSAGRSDAASVQTSIPSGWRNLFSQPQVVMWDVDGTEHLVTYAYRRDSLMVAIDGDPIDVCVVDAAGDEADIEIDGVRRRYRVATIDASTWINDERGQTLCVALPRFPAVENEAAAGSLASPLPGKVLSVDVAVGDTVAAGAVVARLEAMKMEHTISAPQAGIVIEVCVAVGAQVAANEVLARIETET